MNKTLLIIQREYLSRVQKKSFILTTILLPLVFAGIYALVIWLTIKPGEIKNISVVDQSGIFHEKFEPTKTVIYEYIEADPEQAKEQVREGKYAGTLIIPDIDLAKPEGFTLYSKEAMGIGVERSIRRTIRSEIEDIKLADSGIDKNVLDSIQTPISIQSINLGSGEEKESNTGLATGIGIFSGFLIYIFLFVYGTQVMRGVIEEKSSKIVEIIISSVRPTQLMLGKILGIAAVGLSQFLIWVVLTFTLWTFVTPLLLGDQIKPGAQTETMQQITTDEMETGPSDEEAVIASINNAIAKTNISKIVGLLLFYFLTGYLLYAALFAMIGSAVDSESDSQQFIFPVILPIIFSFLMYGAVINDPNGPIAFWLSIIPFTAPIIMMIRVPFEIPDWQIILSMVVMVAGFVFTSWLAGRIYRVGILMHGTKVNYKTLGKWFMMKN